MSPFSIPGESVSVPSRSFPARPALARPPLTDIAGEGEEEAEVKASLGFQLGGVSRPRVGEGEGGGRVRESCQCIISTITQLLHRLSICEMREDSLVTFQFPRFTHHRRRSGNSRGGNVVGVSFASSCASSPYLVVSPRYLTYRVQTTAVPHFACPSHICGGGGRELCVQSQHSTYMCGRLKTK